MEIQKNTPYNSPFLFDFAESSSNVERSQIQGHPKAKVIKVSSNSTTLTKESKQSKFKELSHIYIETDGYYVAYKPITLSCILFMFIKMIFIHCHSCVMLAMKFMSMCNDYVNYDEIIYSDH